MKCVSALAHEDSEQVWTALDWASEEYGKNVEMSIGYARVSTDDQSTAAQVEQLEAFGCQRIYKENKSGGSAADGTDPSSMNQLKAFYRATRWWFGS
jgi:Resolvase, N terminal domain